MKIGTPKEVFAGENRVAMTPESAKQLQKLGYECAIEAGAGANAGFSDADYSDAGVIQPVTEREKGEGKALKARKGRVVCTIVVTQGERKIEGAMNSS